MLFSERKRDEEIARREAAGENLWRETIPNHARVRLLEIAERCAELLWDSREISLGGAVASRLRARLGRSMPTRLDLAFETEDHIGILDWLGAAFEIFEQKWSEDAAQEFADLVNAVFREERIAYKFVDGALIEFSSDELITEVVEPAVRLLVDKRFDAAHGAYMNALKEISNGEAGDAITDAGSALQETLKALGCKGNSLGAQLTDAKRRGLLARHDQALTDGISKVIDWASADRSETGDAHKHPDAAVADAWLMVHVVGALIVRLADPTLRNATS